MFVKCQPVGSAARYFDAKVSGHVHQVVFKLPVAKLFLISRRIANLLILTLCSLFTSSSGDIGIRGCQIF